MTMSFFAAARRQPPSIFVAIGIQARVIGALMMREIYARFGRDNIGFLWIVGEPLMFIGGVLAVRTALQVRLDSGVSFVVILATGYPPLVLWRHCILRSMNGMRQNYPLLYHRRVQPIDIIWARNLVEVCGVLIASIVCYSVLLAVGEVHMPVDFSWFLLGWLFHIWFSIGTGFMVAATSEMTVAVEKLVPVVGYLWLPLGGAFYLVSWLPYAYWPYALAMPSVDAYEIMRQGYWGRAVETHYDMEYTILACFVWMLLGIALLKYARRRMDITE